MTRLIMWLDINVDDAKPAEIVEFIIFVRSNYPNIKIKVRPDNWPMHDHIKKIDRYIKEIEAKKKT